MPEVTLRKALHARGLRFRLHQRLIPGSRRSADIVMAGPRLVIDVRGCFWHGCPEHGRLGAGAPVWWRNKIEENTQRDIDTENLLRAAGWRVYVVWEHDDFTLAAEAIRDLVKGRPQT